MLILGIETSCDETAVAIIKNKQVLSNKILTQSTIHEQLGGIVPEVASRNHVEFLPHLIEKVFEETKIQLKDIDAIASTGGPGLIGSLIIGIVYGKTLASVIKKKFIAINHLEGHILIPKISKNIEYPYLSLLISGGHCQIIIIEKLGKYHIIAKSIDDAIGEVFDKVANLLSLGYPGGPIIEEYANKGNKRTFKFPKPLLKSLIRSLR